MIWLASFPRSGNTFFRNILFEVFGLESSTYHQDPDYFLDENFASFPFVKTHLLPQQLPQEFQNIPSVYIVRDGRDALCSIAHHRKDIIAPGSDFYDNLKTAIIADKGSFFGGWSKNVLEWANQAKLIIRYENLLSNPLHEIERIRQVYDIPDPDMLKFPEFEKLKFGIPKYGSGKDRGYTEDKMRDLAQKNFRKGKAGSWKEEMPDELHDLFWSYHGDVMEKMGYSIDGEIKSPHPDLDYILLDKLGIDKKAPGLRKKRVLIESNKLVSPDNDGVKRYQVELLKGLLPLSMNENSGWQIDLYIHGNIYPLSEFRKEIATDFSLSGISDLDGSKRKKSFFERMERFLVSIVPHGFVNFLAKHNITIFHRAYEFLKRVLFMTGILLMYLKNMISRLFHKNGKAKAEAEHQGQLNDYDLIHLPLKHHFKPFENVDTKFVSTIHDLTHLYFPEYHTKINISNSENGINFLLKKNANMIAVSESTRQDLVKEYKIPDERLQTIYEAADREKFNYKINKDDGDEVLKRYGIEPGLAYIICLSTLEPRKNLKNTLKGFFQFIKENPDTQLKLVVSGKKGWHINKLQVAHDWIINRVIFTGFVDDRDISYLYSNAIAMSYVSYYEGFGLPPLEAMTCGTPVIYGNNSSMIEVVGEGGLPCDPNDVNEIKEKIGSIYLNKKLREELSRKAFKQSIKFSWRKTVIETLEVYNRIIENSDIH